MQLQLWMVLAAMAVLFFLISVQLIMRALFATKALQWAKHRKSVYKAEALWVWRVMFVLTLAIGIAEYVKRGAALTATGFGTFAYCGFALLALGLIVWLAAMHARKQYLWYFQVLAPKEELPVFSTNGIYAEVRNPRELGLLLALAGLAAVFALTFTLVFVIILLLPATAFRAGTRDRVLIEKQGKPYIDYIRTSKKLIPFVF